MATTTTITCDPDQKYLIVEVRDDVLKDNYDIQNAGKSDDFVVAMFIWDITTGFITFDFNHMNIDDHPNVKSLPRIFIPFTTIIHVKIPETTLVKYSEAMNYDYTTIGSIKYMWVVLDGMPSFFEYHTMIPHHDIKHEIMFDHIPGTIVLCKISRNGGSYISYKPRFVFCFDVEDIGEVFMAFNHLQTIRKYNHKCIKHNIHKCSARRSDIDIICDE